MQTHQAQPRPATGPVAQGKSGGVAGLAGLAATTAAANAGLDPTTSAAAGVVAAGAVAAVGTYARNRAHEGEPGLWGVIWWALGYLL